jgi:hypothetical protein
LNPHAGTKFGFLLCLVEDKKEARQPGDEEEGERETRAGRMLALMMMASNMY